MSAECLVLVSAPFDARVHPVRSAFDGDRDSFVFVPTLSFARWCVDNGISVRIGQMSHAVGIDQYYLKLVFDNKTMAAVFKLSHWYRPVGECMKS